MKIPKKYHTNFSTDNLDSVKISQSMSNLLEEAVPKNILGMLSTVEEQENSLLFYRRWKLVILGKNNYSILDTVAKTVVYENVALLVSALYMIYYLNKPITDPYLKYQLIYSLDQQYYRCLEKIKLYKKKIKTKDSDKLLFFSSRLQDSYYRLDEIKTQLSKIY